MKTPFFPMTSKAFITSLCALAGAAFLLYFFLAPPPPVYTYLRSETGEVTAIFPKHDVYTESEASVSVRFNDGTIVYAEVPKQHRVEIGQTVDVDILESEREKLFFRLTPVSPQP